MIALGDIAASKLYVGGEEVTKAYYGTTIVYPKRFELIYDWEAVDWTSGNWYDRIANAYLTPTGSPTKGTDANGDAYIEVNRSKYMTRAQGGNIPIPRNFVFEVTMMRTVSDSTNPWYFMDWGSLSSVGTSYSGYGFYLRTDGRLGVNCKPKGNTTAGGLVHTSVLSNNEKYTVRLGNRMDTETKDRNWIEVNNVKEEATANHDKFYNLNTCVKFIGRGWINSSGYHGGTGWIYSVKIYKDLLTV